MLLGFVLGVGKDLAAELVERDGLEGGGVLASFHGREAKKLANELIELASFTLDASEMNVELGGGVVVRELEGDAETGEWRTQFVGNVAEKKFLCTDERLEPFGHVVEVVDEALEFVGVCLRGGGGRPLHAHA